MQTSFHLRSQIVLGFVSMVAALWAGSSAANGPGDMASFATGGYARGLQSQNLMSKMDTDGDGMVSKAEWLGYHERLFDMLDKHKSDFINAKAFIAARQGPVATFATGGYARGLCSDEMMNKIDTNGDGKISREEFMAYESRVFDMMDTSKTHAGIVGKEEIMFATGGYNRE